MAATNLESLQGLALKPQKVHRARRVHSAKGVWGPKVFCHRPTALEPGPTTKMAILVIWALDECKMAGKPGLVLDRMDS